VLFARFACPWCPARVSLLELFCDVLKVAVVSSSCGGLGDCVGCRDGTPLEQKKWEHLRMAKALMYSCWRMYVVTPTGLAADVYHYGSPEDPRPKIGVRHSACLLLLSS
jgi:hypothetical protein